ncbi:CD48 antigen-like [Discoglossus pictus]
MQLLHQLVYLLLQATLPLGTSSVPLQVNGLINQSVYLSNYFDLTLPVEEVVWHFTRDGQKVKVAEFKDLHLTIKYRLFTNRLEATNNGTTLRILGLRMEDSGIFTADITLTNQTIKELSFNLTVYEPVPKPNISKELQENTSDWCNFTLHCSVPIPTLCCSISWMRRLQDQTYQYYRNGSTVLVALQPDAWTTEFLCLVRNPADQKNASIQSPEICPFAKRRKEKRNGADRGYYNWIPILVFIILLLLILSVIIYKWKRKHEEPFNPTTPENTDVLYTENSEVLYTVVQASPQVCKQNPHNPEQRADNQPHLKFDTIYTEIKRPV